MLFYLVDWKRILIFVLSNLKQRIMKTISLITLTLSTTLLVMSSYVNEPILGVISIFGMAVSLTTFIDAFYCQKKSKKTY